MAALPLRKLGQTDIEISALGLGAWQFSGGKGLVGGYWQALDADTTRDIVRAAVTGGINWFDNSRHAAFAARQFAIDMGEEIKGLGTNSWGMSASMGASKFYNGKYGSLPAGYQGKQMDRLTMDGTVAPYGSSGFIVFTPEASIDALETMYTIPGLVGKYGLYDAYSFHTKATGDRPWVAETYLGIDKGIVALMFENYSTQLIWKLFHQNDYVQNGLKELGFTGMEPDMR